jgi:hypothetical protein
MNTTSSGKPHPIYIYRIEYSENNNEANIKLYWSSPSIMNETIPSEFYYKSEYISGGSVDTLITCPIYFDGDNKEHPKTCYPECGDGFRFGQVKYNF